MALLFGDSADRGWLTKLTKLDTYNKALQVTPYRPLKWRGERSRLPRKIFLSIVHHLSRFFFLKPSRYRIYGDSFLLFFPFRYDRLMPESFHEIYDSIERRQDIERKRSCETRFSSPLPEDAVLCRPKTCLEANTTARKSPVPVSYCRGPYLGFCFLLAVVSRFTAHTHSLTRLGAGFNTRGIPSADTKIINSKRSSYSTS